MKKAHFVSWLVGVALFACAILGLMIAFGGPTKPAAMPSINAPFSGVDFSGLPEVRTFSARDSMALRYRFYASVLPSSRGSVVLIHGSSASSRSMHPMARAMSAAGFDVYALDMRGHGDSGEKGTISYIGQLEDDVEDFLLSARPSGKRTLVGFSSGGGFALRFAGSRRQQLFDSYLLLSPFLHQDAPTYRSNSGGWVNIGIPRIVALTVLNQLGITALNHLAVVEFALDERARSMLTPSYSYSLAANFRPHHDYRADIRNAGQPLEVLVGANDELFHAEAFEAAFSAAGKPGRVTIVPGVMHIPLTLDRVALEQAVSAIGRLNRTLAVDGQR